MPSALVLLSSGFEEIEAVTIIDLLRRADIKVTVAGLQKDLVTGSHNINIKPDVYYKEVNHNSFDALILPGGQPGSANLKADAQVLNWIQERHLQGKMLAAICAAPTVFHAAGITKNLQLTSYPSEKEVFSDSHYSEETVVTDGAVITSRGVGTAIEFSLKLIEKLQGSAAAQTVAERILYKNQ